MKITMLLTIVSLAFFSCTNQAVPEKNEKQEVKAELKNDSLITSEFTIKAAQDTVATDGDHIERYPNGVIRIRGMMKAGKREGLWKSWYEDGKQWSETTFRAGIKNGKTTTWYENGNKRYEGAYTDDEESGMWTYWDESGKEVSKQDLSKKKP